MYYSFVIVLFRLTCQVCLFPFIWQLKVWFIWLTENEDWIVTDNKNHKMGNIELDSDRKACVHFAHLSAVQSYK